MLGVCPLLKFLKICLSGIQVGCQTVWVQIITNIFSLNLTLAVDKVYQPNSLINVYTRFAISRQLSNLLEFYLPVSSADNLCKQFGPRFYTLLIFPKYFFRKNNNKLILKKISADDKR